MKNALLVVSCAAVLSASALDVELQGNGEVCFGGLRLLTCIHGEGWRENAEGSSMDFPNAAGTASYEVRVPWRQKDAKSCWARGSASLVQTADGRAFYAMNLVSLLDQKPEAVMLELRLPADRAVGGTWETSDGRKGTFAKDFDAKRMHPFSGAFDWVRITPPQGKPVTLSFPVKTSVALQDDRQWVKTFSLRVSPVAGSSAGPFPKGAVRAYQCYLSSPDGIRVKYARPVVVKAGDGWSPIDYVKDVEAGTALDFSNQGLQDAPAGKYGWLRNVGGHFEFEGRPGKPVRLYGVNLCFDANFPEQDEADRLVTRLVRLGYNTIRVHHYESANGVVKGSPDHKTVNPERTRKLDYLLSRAIAAGLYVTTDLYTCRDVRWSEIGLPRPDWATGDIVDKQVYKNLIAVWQPAFDNWKTFACNFLTHVNPYTGRRYADEPALPLVSLINEGHLSWCWSKINRMEPMKKAWREWLAGRRAAKPGYAAGVSDDCEQMKDTNSGVFGDFMADLETDLVRREREAMREIGVKALLTSENCGWHSASLEAMREKCYDYVDDHFYVDHPQFLDRPWSLPSKCDNRNPVLSGWLPPEVIAFTRLADKPFTVTEWNFSGPGMFRGVGGIMTGAMSALQDWDGLWRFAYSHGLEGMRSRQGFPGYFDVASDPLGQASDRASVCLFLRRDLEPLAENAALAYAPADFHDGKRWRGVVPAWRGATWNLKVATTAGGSAAGWNVFPAAGEKGVAGRETAPVKACPGEAIVLDRARGSFAINTPRTAGGFAPSGSLAAGAVRFDVGEVAATVWASSLDGRPIVQSRRMLVTHLTDVQADGNVYADKAKTVLLKWGSYPPIARNGKARIELALDDPAGYAVWGLETSGRRLERIPCEVNGGKLCFTANVAARGGARLLYEVVK